MWILPCLPLRMYRRKKEWDSTIYESMELGDRMLLLLYSRSNWWINKNEITQYLHQRSWVPEAPLPYKMEISIE